VKRHEFDLFPLIAGLVFLAIAVVYGLDAAGAWDVNSLWVLGCGLAGLGIAGLAGTATHLLRSTRRPHR
jgi:hypothetical protein